ncbi:MAG: hypothetical protein F4Z53_08705 [Acidimicrobiales bacterium]|nr:hypothetical protein [Acidimicrobiales bacterium]MYD33277.1 hypothetical protein [Acidimicrobiales bacterium]MYI10566.1 hypothetical protein [Acidimicrobiales bacterium]
MSRWRRPPSACCSLPTDSRPNSPPPPPPAPMWSSSTSPVSTRAIEASRRWLGRSRRGCPPGRSDCP